MTISSWAGLSFDKPRLMGVVNVTPDSFSDGGKFWDTAAAIDQCHKLVEEGADILDLGGESTRPGAKTVTPTQEQDRILPVVEALRDSAALLSVDTRNPSTAQAAVEAGVQIWNDVTALKGDPSSLSSALKLKVPLCLMHMRGSPKTMQVDPTYKNVVLEVQKTLLEQADALTTRGFDPSLICLDVGIGFGKTLQHNLALMSNLEKFISLPFAHMLGVSRKSYIEKIMEKPLPANQRLPGSIATAVIALQKGCRLFRVHDVKETKQALTIAEQILRVA